MATVSEVLQVTGYEIGTVTPLGLSQSIRIIADVRIFQLDEISIGSGIRSVAIIMNTSNLKAALGKIEIDLLT